MKFDILLAEDDSDLAKIIKLYLTQAGFTVRVVENGEDAMGFLLENKVRLAVLDWMMPGMSGMDVCRRIRSFGSTVKILILTSRDSANDELTGFSNGADDYVKKPFVMDVLIARVRRLIGNDDAVRWGSMVLRRGNSSVDIDGLSVNLTKTELGILECLIDARGNVVSRQSILDSVWGFGSSCGLRAVDTNVGRLRAKLGASAIRTKPGLGYYCPADETESDRDES